MGKDRKKRAKDEGTFLEGVKILLAELQQNVMHIKFTVDKLQLEQNSIASSLGFIQHCTGTWPTWDSGEVWSSFGLDIPSTHTANGTSLSAEAPCFIPESTALDRGSLLRLRASYGKMSEPEEVANIGCAVAPAYANLVSTAPKLWRRSRPSAKVRRKRRAALIVDVRSANRAGENITVNCCQTACVFESCGSEPPGDQDEPELCDQDVSVVTSDSHEMILPVSQGTWLRDSQQAYPLKLQRDAFFTWLPGNADLLLQLECGLERGAAYRTDWAEENLSSSSSAVVDAPCLWKDDELKVWIQVTMRMAASQPTSLMRLAFVQRRWEEAKPHIPADKMDDMQTLVIEVSEIVQSWPEDASEK